MHANKREEIDVVYCGDIAAAVGLKDTTTGDTLCAENAPIVLEKMEFPEPVISVAVEPKTKADQEKMGIVTRRSSDGRVRVSRAACGRRDAGRHLHHASRRRVGRARRRLVRL